MRLYNIQLLAPPPEELPPAEEPPADDEPAVDDPAAEDAGAEELPAAEDAPAEELTPPLLDEPPGAHNARRTSYPATVMNVMLHAWPAGQS